MLHGLEALGLEPLHNMALPVPAIEHDVAAANDVDLEALGFERARREERLLEVLRQYLCAARELARARSKLGYIWRTWTSPSTLRMSVHCLVCERVSVKTGTEPMLFRGTKYAWRRVPAAVTVAGVLAAAAAAAASAVFAFGRGLNDDGVRASFGGAAAGGVLAACSVPAAASDWE